MAPRIGFSMKVLRSLQSEACESDMRLVIKSGDEWNMGIVSRGVCTNLPKFCGTREMRLLALQLIRMAEHMEMDDHPLEVVLP